MSFAFIFSEIFWCQPLSDCVCQVMDVHPPVAEGSNDTQFLVVSWWWRKWETDETGNICCNWRLKESTSLPENDG